MNQRIGDNPFIVLIIPSFLPKVLGIIHWTSVDNESLGDYQ